MSGTEDRERRWFWVAVDGVVTNEEGHTCAPMNPGYWWFPRVGRSICLGHGAFESKGEATAAARAYCAGLRATADRLERAL